MRVAALVMALLAGPAAADGFPAPVGGAFALVDQHGRARSERDPQGRMQLVFFGYASCQQICSVALPAMAEAAALAAEAGVALVPVLITVDPDRDSPAALAAALEPLHPDFLGLTGTEAALASARAAFGVAREVLFSDVTGPIYAHGSFLYLLDPDGRVLSILPPILAPARIVAIAQARAPGG